jgi:F420-dependent oxidoreductase-like protein
MGGMRISLSVTNFTWPGSTGGIPAELTRIAQAADDGGLAALWVADHLLQADPSSTPEAEMLEAYTTLGYLAARTERVQLGTMVTGATFRIPALLVKAVTTLDVLSGGRAWLGIGTGYGDEEAEAMGIPMPPLVERYERLEEILRLARQMWSGDDAPFTGEHFRLGRPIGSPLPVRRPPVLIGGAGEKKTLPLVARYGDACNLFDIPDGGETVRRKLEVLAAQCADLGRPYDEIEKTVSMALQPDEPAGAFAERVAAQAGLGIEHAIVITRSGGWTEDGVATLAGAAAQVREL